MTRPKPLTLNDHDLLGYHLERSVELLNQVVDSIAEVRRLATKKRHRDLKEDAKNIMRLTADLRTKLREME